MSRNKSLLTVLLFSFLFCLVAVSIFWMFLLAENFKNNSQIKYTETTYAIAWCAHSRTIIFNDFDTAWNWCVAPEQDGRIEEIKEYYKCKLHDCEKTDDSR